MHGGVADDIAAPVRGILIRIRRSVALEKNDEDRGRPLPGNALSGFGVVKSRFEQRMRH